MFIYIWLILVVFVEGWYALTGPVCLDCKGISQPQDCNTVTTCGVHESCYVEKYVTNGGIVLHNTGCKDTTICSLSIAVAVGRREVKIIPNKRDNAVICTECCNSKNICNQNGCGVKPVQIPVGSKLCYKCPGSIRPDMCTEISLCGNDESCSIMETTNLLGKKRWKHDCLKKQQCSPTTSGCSYCCDSELCNDRCNQTSSVTTTVTQTQTTTPLVTYKSTITSQNTIITTIAKSTTQRSTQLITQGNIQSTPYRLTTTSQLPLKSPIITLVEKRPHVIHYGDTVIISCQATGNPKPSYNFKFRDGPLPNNTRVKDNTLTIFKFVIPNTGNYECIASNSEGTGSFGLHLDAHF